MTKPLAKPPAIVAAGHTNMIFIAVPNERGRYLRTHICVAYEPCPLCKATLGEPCKHTVAGRLRYNSSVHYRRSFAFKEHSHSIEWTPTEPAPPQQHDDACGQLWVLGKKFKDKSAKPWRWYAQIGWDASHADVILFPSRIAAEAKMDRLGADPRCDLEVMPLEAAQEIWHSEHDKP